ncbi:TonB-dependent receptor [Ekhidna sp.]|uniref:TonB-dependent receptor n=1 Tax=Ekhidna sp. TaxID=2608089 RepID=UPI003B58CB0B
MRYLTIIFLIVSFHGFAQTTNCNRSVSGKILDIDTNEPLPFATVKVKDTNLGAVADELGQFKITGICQDEIDLEVRFLGYKTVVHHHDFHHPSPVIFMAPEETLLESVVVEEKLNAHELKTLEPKNFSISASDRSGTTAADLLTKSSGVNTLKTGQNVVKPIVHGLHSNRVLIINNGVRHSYQAWGNEHAPEIDPSQIDRIQLIKGSSTVRYGPNALGGVILFDAPQPSYNQPIEGNIGIGYQTNGRSISSELSIKQGLKRHAWQVSINGTKQGDLKAPDYYLTNTGKKEFGYSLSSKHHFSWIDIDLYASHFEQELGLLRGSVNGNLIDLINAIGASSPNDTRSYFSYDIRTPRQETVHDLFKFKSAIFIGEQQFDIQYAYQRNERREFDIRRGTNNDRPAIDLLLKTHTLDLDWDHPSQGSLAGTLGVQAFYQDNDNIPGTNTIPFVPNYNNSSIGIFSIESLTKGKTTYEAGIRYDFLNMNVRGRDSSNDIYRDNRNYQNFTFTVGLIHQLNEELSIRTNIGTAWRSPNIGELFSFGRHQIRYEYGIWRYNLPPSGINSNSIFTKATENERGIKWISSFDLRKPTIELEFTPYINWIDNYFFIRPYGITNTVRGAFPYFIYDQTTALYYGTDLDIRKKFNKKTEAELKASFVYAEDIKSNQPFIGIPPFNIQLEVSRKLGNFIFQLNPTWTAKQTHAPPVIDAENFIANENITFDQSVIFDFLAPPDSFFLLNASVQYEKNNFSTKLTGANLLDTSYRSYMDQYRYFADDIGVNLKLFMSYSF